jgi:hypothetical protein
MILEVSWDGLWTFLSFGFTVDWLQHAVNSEVTTTHMDDKEVTSIHPQPVVINHTA